MDEKAWDRLANNYHEEVVSPFYGNVKNPLIPELKKIKSKQKTVAEFGCGLFHLAPFLAKNFKTVHASDFSQVMVNKAKQQAKKFTNVSIKKEDLTKISYMNKFDVIIAVNAVIMPSHKDILESFTNLFNALKKKGVCFLILPSMEAVLYHGMLLLHSELIGNKEQAAKKIAKKRFEKEKYDLYLGLYKDGNDIQKFFYHHEIQYFISKVGFQHINISKIEYPWESNDYESFPEEQRIWDWFVKATI